MTQQVIKDLFHSSVNYVVSSNSNHVTAPHVILLEQEKSRHTILFISLLHKVCHLLALKCLPNIFNKKESGSLDFTGLEISREYHIRRWKHLKGCSTFLYRIKLDIFVFSLGVSSNMNLL
ncbi:MAG: hypothetical protein ACK5JH_06540 [Anaerocolumna sp.]